MNRIKLAKELIKLAKKLMAIDPIRDFRTRAWELNIGDEAEEALRSKDISHIPKKLQRQLAPLFNEAVGKFHKPGRQKTLADWEAEAETRKGPLHSLMQEAWLTNTSKEVVRALNTKNIHHLPELARERLEPYFTKVIKQG